MKEILFRGKRVDDGQWIYGDLLTANGTECEISDWNEVDYSRHDVDHETVGQYTGIDDREGDKIFEGDIFKIGAENNIYTVRFDYGCFLAYEDDVQVGILAELSTMFIKKIGNIHDNKELLK